MQQNEDPYYETKLLNVIRKKKQISSHRKIEFAYYYYMDVYDLASLLKYVRAYDTTYNPTANSFSTIT